MATAAEPFSPVPVTVEPQEVNSSVLVSTFLRRPTAQDGHELVQMTDSPVVASFTGQAQFDPKDLQVVLEVSKYPILLTMRSDQPWKSVEELAEYAKANPGKVRIAIPASAGSNHHIGFLAIQRALGAQLVMLPNQSSNEAALTVLGGGAELCQTPYSAVGPHVKEGTMRVLASVGSVRAEEAPDAPTFKELGYEVEIDNIQFLSVPAAVPKDRVTWLHQLFVRALQQEETQRLLRERGFPPPPTILSPEEATASLQKRAAEYETGVKEAGLYKPRQ
jgi:tripartite-type tricarboxylate transporter receptor subunit TctC